MKWHDYSGPEQFRPLSAWAYFGYSILFLIPVIGWIFLIVFTFSAKNYNRRGFARSYWCGIIVVAVITAAIVATGISTGFFGKYIAEPIREFYEENIGGELGDARKPASSQKPKTDSNDAGAPAAAPSADDSRLRPEFKKAMDSYEAFYDEYIATMEKVAAGSDDAALLARYAKMMEQAVEMDKSLEEWDGDMNSAEAAYSVDVSARVMKKMIAATK